jgi:hypothetical protein
VKEDSTVNNGVISAMNTTNRNGRLLTAGLAGLTAVLSGTSTGCTEEEVNLALQGARIIVDELTDEPDDDISFGDWLASELND